MLRSLRRLVWRILGDPPDPAWHPSRPVPRFTGHDPQLSRQGLARAALRAARIRRANASGAIPNRLEDADHGELE